MWPPLRSSKGGILPDYLCGVEKNEGEYDAERAKQHEQACVIG